MNVLVFDLKIQNKIWKSSFYRFFAFLVIRRHIIVRVNLMKDLNLFHFLSNDISNETLNTSLNHFNFNDSVYFKEMQKTRKTKFGKLFFCFDKVSIFLNVVIFYDSNKTCGVHLALKYVFFLLQNVKSKERFVSFLLNCSRIMIFWPGHSLNNICQKALKSLPVLNLQLLQLPWQMGQAHQPAFLPQ